jgi:hypothetical protein
MGWREIAAPRFIILMCSMKTETRNDSCVGSGLLILLDWHDVMDIIFYAAGASGISG